MILAGGVPPSSEILTLFETKNVLFQPVKIKK